MRIIDQRHFIDGDWLVMGVVRNTRSGAFFLDFPNRLSRNSRDNDNDSDSREQANISKRLLKGTGERRHFACQRVARYRADVYVEEYAWEHAQKVCHNVGTGTDRCKSKEVIQQSKRERRTQTCKQDHLETLTANSTVQRTELWIAFGPKSYLLAQKRPRE